MAVKRKLTCFHQFLCYFLETAVPKNISGIHIKYFASWIQPTQERVIPANLLSSCLWGYVFSRNSNCATIL